MTASHRPRPALEARIKQHLSELIDHHFPALHQVRIELRRAKKQSCSVFLETDVDRSTILRRPKKRRYLIYVSDRLEENAPGDDALCAILVHELFHIQDYSEKSLWGLIRLNRKYRKDLEYQVAYERRTDLRTMELGFAEGLKAYRTWLYGIMNSATDLRVKKQLYFTPEEIDVWLKKTRGSADQKRGGTE